MAGPLKNELFAASLINTNLMVVYVPDIIKRYNGTARASLMFKSIFKCGVHTLKSALYHRKCIHIISSFISKVSIIAKYVKFDFESGCSDRIRFRPLFFVE